MQFGFDTATVISGRRKILRCCSTRIEYRYGGGRAYSIVIQSSKGRDIFFAVATLSLSMESLDFPDEGIP
jgi:hypothetical protein